MKMIFWVQSAHAKTEHCAHDIGHSFSKEQKCLFEWFEIVSHGNRPKLNNPIKATKFLHCLSSSAHGYV